jgi:2-desacetyl-2-hydroxyethyl bacteriochlorophyllide A dehydrogenase
VSGSCAVWFTAARTVELREEEVVPPGPGEIQVRAIASAVSRGTEMLVYRGEVPDGLALDLPSLAGGFEFPIKYGYASVGRVAAVGADVVRPVPGDVVFALHPHQSTYTLSAELAVPLPPGLDPELGTFTANLESAISIVHDTQLRLGETAVVFGQGVVGLLVTQLLRRAGAGRVLAIDPVEGRRALAVRVGADEALPPGNDLRERVRSRTDGRGADVVVEVSGSTGALQQAVEAVAIEGTVVVASWYGVKPVALELGGHFHRGRIRLHSSQVGRIAPELSARWDHQRRLATAVELLPQLELAALVTSRQPLHDAADVYHRLDEHPDEDVLALLTYGDADV